MDTLLAMYAVVKSDIPDAVSGYLETEGVEEIVFENTSLAGYAASSEPQMQVAHKLAIYAQLRHSIILLIILKRLQDQYVSAYSTLHFFICSKAEKLQVPIAQQMINSYLDVYEGPLAYPGIRCTLRIRDLTTWQFREFAKLAELAKSRLESMSVLDHQITRMRMDPATECNVYHFAEHHLEMTNRDENSFNNFNELFLYMEKTRTLNTPIGDYVKNLFAQSLDVFREDAKNRFLIMKQHATGKFGKQSRIPVPKSGIAASTDTVESYSTFSAVCSGKIPGQLLQAFMNVDSDIESFGVPVPFTWETFDSLFAVSDGAQNYVEEILGKNIDFRPTNRLLNIYSDFVRALCKDVIDPVQVADIINNCCQTQDWDFAIPHSPLFDNLLVTPVRLEEKTPPISSVFSSLAAVELATASRQSGFASRTLDPADRHELEQKRERRGEATPLPTQNAARLFKFDLTRKRAQFDEMHRGIDDAARVLSRVMIDTPVVNRASQDNYRTPGNPMTGEQGESEPGLPQMRSLQSSTNATDRRSTIDPTPNGLSRGYTSQWHSPAKLREIVRARTKRMYENDIIVGQVSGDLLMDPLPDAEFDSPLRPMKLNPRRLDHNALLQRLKPLRRSVLPSFKIENDEGATEKNALESAGAKSFASRMLDSLQDIESASILSGLAGVIIQAAYTVASRERPAVLNEIASNENTTGYDGNRYWRTQMNYGIRSWVKLSEIIANLENLARKELQNACRLFQLSLRLYALRLVVAKCECGGVTDPPETDAILSEAYATLKKCVAKCERITIQSKIVKDAACIFAERVHGAVVTIVEKDGFLELFNLGTGNRADVWRIPTAALHTHAPKYIAVPNNLRAYIVDCIAYVQTSCFDTSPEMNRVSDENEWLTDYMHIYAKLDVLFGKARLGAFSAVIDNDILSANIQHEKSRSLLKLDDAVTKNRDLLKKQYPGLSDIVDGKNFVTDMLKLLLVEQDMLTDNLVYFSIADFTKNLSTSELTPLLQLKQAQEARLYDSWSPVSGVVEFTHNVDSIIRAKMPLDRLTPHAVSDGRLYSGNSMQGGDLPSSATYGKTGNRTDPRSLQKSGNGPKKSSDIGRDLRGAAPDSYLERGGGGSDADNDDEEAEEEEEEEEDDDEDEKEVEADEEEEEEEEENRAVPTWMFDEDDARVIWRIDSTLSDLRAASGISDLELVQSKRLLTINPRAPVARVARGETRLISGDSQYADWVNGSLLVQFATALVAYRAWSGEAEALAQTIEFCNSTLTAILYYIHNRMKVSEISEMSTAIAATLVTFSGRDTIANAICEITGNSSQHRIAHITEVIRLQQGASFAWCNDYDVDQLSDAVDNAVQAAVESAYVVVEFVAPDGAPNYLPNLENMRDLYAVFARKSITNQGTNICVPLCYGYSLPSSVERDTVYHVADWSQQIRDQGAARVHFMLLANDREVAFNIDRRVVGDMPARTCALCGFARSSNKMTHRAYEEHMYAPWYMCAIHQFFDVPGPSIENVLAADAPGDNPVRGQSKFFRQWVRRLRLDSRLGALFGGVLQTSKLADFLRLVATKNDLPRGIGATVQGFFADLMALPLVTGRGGEICEILENKCEVTIQDASAAIAGVAAMIQSPLDRLLRLLKRKARHLTTDAIKSAFLLNGQRQTEQPDFNVVSDDGADAGRTFGEKREFLVKLFVMRFCQMLLLNLPMKSMHNFKSNETCDVPGITADCSIVSALLHASNRPSKKTVEYFQDTPHCQLSDVNAQIADIRVPPERPTLADAKLPPHHAGAHKPPAAAAASPDAGKLPAAAAASAEADASTEAAPPAAKPTAPPAAAAPQPSAQKSGPRRTISKRNIRTIEELGVSSDEDSEVGGLPPRKSAYLNLDFAFMAGMSEVLPGFDPKWFGIAL